MINLSSADDASSPVKYRAIKDDHERKSSKSRRRIITLLNTGKWIVMAGCQHTGLNRGYPDTVSTDDWFFQRRRHTFTMINEYACCLYLTSKYVRLVNIQMCKKREADGWEVESRLKLFNFANPKFAYFVWKSRVPIEVGEKTQNRNSQSIDSIFSFLCLAFSWFTEAPLIQSRLTFSGWKKGETSRNHD
jgi:hypothetical protein